MFIERDGVKIELTQEELAAAYKEVRKQNVKNDIMSSFVLNFLNEYADNLFDDFIEEMTSGEGFSNETYGEAYKELCDAFGPIVVDGLIKNPDEFLEEIYKVFLDEEDCNFDYNSQILCAVKSVLCDRAHETKSFYSQACSDFFDVKKLVRNYEGSFDELCEQLKGFNKEDGNFFDVNYGVLTVTVRCSEDGLVLDNSIDIWNDAIPEPVHECLTFDKFKEICVKAGVDVDTIYNKSSLEDKLADATSRSEELGCVDSKFDALMK